MHPNCMMLMSQFKQKYCVNIKGAKVLDVGSQNINGTFHDLFMDADYLGVDILPGSGVDVVCQRPDEFPFDDNSFDFVISGNTLEHCERPWNTIKEIARVLKHGGIAILIAPWQFHVHKDGLCNKDCYRILPDGYSVLLKDAGLEVLEVGMYDSDAFGIAKKPKERT